MTQIIKESIYNSPLTLLTLNNKYKAEIDNYLPYSTGFEIECNMLPTFKKESFTSIPNIMDVNCDSSEQRFRIPNGLVGIICLYTISERLKENSELNMGSGIHYHIDMTDCYTQMKKMTGNNCDYVLSELDSWEYKGTYNARGISFSGGHNWLRFNDEFQTAEFRLGEMTFDYKVLIKRILHCNNIIRETRKQLNIDTSRTYLDINKEVIFNYLKTNITTISIESRDKINALNNLVQDISDKIVLKVDIKELIKQRNKII